MKRMATALAAIVLLAAPAAMAQARFGWTLSNSTTDPLSNTGPIAPGPSMFAGNLYLWLYCGNGSPGMAAAEFDIVENVANGLPTGFGPLNGFLNAGTATALLLAVGACPVGPVLAGTFTVGPDAFVPDIELCMVNSAANNRNITVACGGAGIVNGAIGFKKTGAAACNTLNTSTCDYTTVDAQSWGQIKGLYR